jgi:hypothetical protein
MEKSRISLEAHATGPDLFLNFWFDGEQIDTMKLTQDTQAFSHDFVDDNTTHVFEIELIGKLPEHTQIDEHGNIIQDRVVEITRVALDDIELGHLVTETAIYHHDSNGTTDARTDRFYGTMGCNGRVELKFTTPIYMWLLENM